MNSTRIMATIADNRCTPEFLQSLRAEGIHSVRINSAHVTPESIARMVSVIRTVDPAIEILMDTKGPEIRTAPVETPVTITDGDTVIITSSHTPCTPGHISVMVDDLHLYLHEGDTVLIDDGDLQFTVTGIEGTEIHTTALRSVQRFLHPPGTRNWWKR